MTGFIVPAPTDPTAEPAIVSSPFWPAILPAEIRDEQRIDGTVTGGRLRGALVEAIAVTNNALAEFRKAQQADGVQKLTDIDAEKIDEKHPFALRYQRAVGCLAKALLLERYRDMDTSGKGDRKADALTDPIDDCRRDHLNAIADITGRSRVTIELI